jgi:hypothetical protein
MLHSIWQKISLTREELSNIEHQIFEANFSQNQFETSDSHEIPLLQLISKLVQYGA